MEDDQNILFFPRNDETFQSDHDLEELPKKLQRVKKRERESPLFSETQKVFKTEEREDRKREGGILSAFISFKLFCCMLYIYLYVFVVSRRKMYKWVAVIFSLIKWNILSMESELSMGVFSLL